MTRLSGLLARAAAAALLVGCAGAAGGEGAVPWPLRDGGWRTDPVWDDGLAEKATYRATRTLYGEPRRYEAVAYTNAQHMDPRTTTKSEDGSGVRVLKHHWSERVPTERYDYDFSTATFTRVDDLAPFKLTAATQEDCGASFKQVVRSEDGGLRWSESVYFPGAGPAEGELPGDVQLADALSLVLRDFPFDAPPEGALELSLVPSQKSTRSVPFAPARSRVRHLGVEELDLPVGRVRAHRLRVEPADGAGGARELWFDARGEAPWLHVLVRERGPDGVAYDLASLERTAYWERP